jgi:hypothetical protein
MALLLAIAVIMFSPERTSATGISIDAGLTPAEGRWMVRSQMRYMHRNNHPVMEPMEMKAYMFPVMAAHGLRSDLTIMVRQALISREMTMMSGSSKNTGLGDFFILAKYRLVRINTPDYTIGIAPTLGLELPTGEENFTSNSYDLSVGGFFSGRMKSMGMDLNLSYILNGLALIGDEKTDPGDEFSVETAISYWLSIGEGSNLQISPVLESKFTSVTPDNQDGNDMIDSGESLLFLSPGLKITWGSAVLEGLIQFPIWQHQKGAQTERDTGFLIGIRLMN